MDYIVHSENWQPLLTGPKGETWMQALKRLEKFCHVDLCQYTDEESNQTKIVNLGKAYDTNVVFEVHQKQHRSEISRIEALYDIRLTDSLAALMCDHGTFSCYHIAQILDRDWERWGGREIFALYDHTEITHLPNILPFSKAIANNFSSIALNGLATEDVLRYLDTN